MLLIKICAPKLIKNSQLDKHMIAGEYPPQIPDIHLKSAAMSKMATQRETISGCHHESL